MNILQKSEITPLSLKSKKPVMKLSNSLKRRRSLKSVKNAKFIVLNKKSMHRKNHYIGDRIMAHRGVMNFENIESAMNKSMDFDMFKDNQLSVPNLIIKTMQPTGKRIIKLSINHQSPSYDEKLKNLLTTCSSVKTQLNRHISILPDRVLDAPDITPGYNNIMDWGNNNVIAVALSRSVYLWNSIDGRVNQLMKYSDESFEIVTCLKWLPMNSIRNSTSDILAVGSNSGNILIWDVVKQRVLKKIFSEVNQSVTSIAVKNDLLSFGLFSGNVEHHFMNQEPSLIALNRYHNGVIVHLKWSNNFQNLAVVSQNSGLSIFSANGIESEHPTTMLPGKINDVTWSYKNFNILLFSCQENTGSLLTMYDASTKKYIRCLNFVTNISCLCWNELFDEIAVVVEEEGYFAISILSDSTLSTLIKLTGHRGDILTMVPNPTGEVIASIGEDEQIRFWNCFQTQDIKKIKNSRNQKSSLLTELERFR